MGQSTRSSNGALVVVCLAWGLSMMWMLYDHAVGMEPRVLGALGVVPRVAASSAGGGGREALVWPKPDLPRGHRFPTWDARELGSAGIFTFRDMETSPDLSAARYRPFVVTNAVEGESRGRVADWHSWKRALSALRMATVPHPEKGSVADYYPFNMLMNTTLEPRGRRSPYLTRVPRALAELEASWWRTGEGGSDAYADPTPSRFARSDPPVGYLPGKYVHVQLLQEHWDRLQYEGLIPKALPGPFAENDEWIEECMRDPTDLNWSLADEWHLKTHWKIVLIGNRGAGMFNHSDVLRTSSWHLHAMGRKWWYVCGPGRDDQCYEGILEAGDVLYYPVGWSHETQILDSPTLTVTDTVAHAGNAKGLLYAAWSECAGLGDHDFRLSGKMCDRLETRCADFWGVRLAGPRGQSWRDHKSEHEVAARDAVLPQKHNYDGTNYITG